MADMIDSQPVAKNSSSEKKSSKKTAANVDHPPYITMITEAIQSLKERNGSSRNAIKKYLHDTYGIVADTHKVYINAALKRGIENGTLKQVSGSFKVNHEHNTATTKANGAKATKKSDKEAAKSPVKKSTTKKADAAPKKAAKTASDPKKTTPKKASAAASKKGGRPPKSAAAKSPKVTKKAAAAH